MPLKDRTKQLFADELLIMLHEMPLAKVRVGELCGRCGAGRQTFYYHFRDKYDVVAWIFERDYRMAEADTIPCEDAVATVARALELMWSRRAFYRAAFADVSQNSIAEHIQDFDVRLLSAVAKEHLGTEELSPWQLFAIKHHSYGSIGCTIEWLKGELDANPVQIAEWEFARMPDFLREAYRTTAKSDC